MTTDNFILQNWQLQQKIFTENIIIIRRRPTKDSVHDLRVAVKRMRSYLRLKQKITGENWKEQFAGTTLLFKSLGRLRDFDMSLTLLRRYQNKEQPQLSAFQKYLYANRNLTRRWAKEAAAKFNEEELNYFTEQFISSFAAFTDAELGDKTVEAARGNLNKTNQLARHFQKNVHEIRKLLKDVYYWMKICPEEQSNGVIKIKSLDKMLNNLGSWQDYFIFQEKLKYFRKEYLPKGSAEILLIKTMEEKSALEQDVLLAKAKSQWSDVVQ